MGVCGCVQAENVEVAERPVAPAPAPARSSPARPAVPAPALRQRLQRPIDQHAADGLPPGWIVRRDPATNRIYYQNNIEKRTQWERPAKPPELPVSPQLPPNWVSLRDARTGRVYYQNNKLKLTQWEPPKAPPKLDLDQKEPEVFQMGGEHLDRPQLAELQESVKHDFTKSEQEFIDIFKPDSGVCKRCDTAVFEYGECAVCFEALYENIPTVMLDNAGDKRTCRHFICHACAQEILEDGEQLCPLCRAEFHGIQTLPDLEKEPHKWFDVIDFDGTGQLRRQELVDALTAILPIPQSRIHSDLDVLWEKWDTNKTSKLTSQQALVSIVPYVKRKIDLPLFQQGVIPDLTRGENIVTWFDYWDVDGNGVIDKYELARALLKSFGQYMSKRSVRKLIKNLLVVTWGMYADPDKSEITLTEFSKEDGLAETLLATLTQVKLSAQDKLNQSSESLDGAVFPSESKVVSPSEVVKRSQSADDAQPSRNKVQSNVQAQAANLSPDKQSKVVSEQPSVGLPTGYFQLPPAAPPEEEKVPERLPEAPARSEPGLGILTNFNSDELARMDTETLQDVLTQWHQQRARAKSGEGLVSV